MSFREIMSGFIIRGTREPQSSLIFFPLMFFLQFFNSQPSFGIVVMDRIRRPRHIFFAPFFLNFVDYSVIPSDINKIRQVTAGSIKRFLHFLRRYITVSSE